MGEMFTVMNLEVPICDLSTHPFCPCGCLIRFCDGERSSGPQQNRRRWWRKGVCGGGRVGLVWRPGSAPRFPSILTAQQSIRPQDGSSRLLYPGVSLPVLHLWTVSLAGVSVTVAADERKKVPLVLLPWGLGLIPDLP